MPQDISGFSTKVRLTASFTFPTGITITQFADDTDPLDLASIDIADKAMGLNGDLITWARAVPAPMVLAVIPSSGDDQNLQLLAEANRPSIGKPAVGDLFQAMVVYPNGSVVTLTNGRLTNAPFGKSIAGSQRLKTKVYAFAFEQVLSS
jgi:hypothetical protein